MSHRTALVLIDYQNDFAHRDGALYVAGGDAILPAVHALIAGTRSRGGLIVATQDWHPAGHVSFAATHGLPPFTVMDGEMLWPVHCVAGGWGADFFDGLDLTGVDRCVRKAFELERDSYSGFGGREFHASRPGATLEHLLRDHGVQTIDVAGLATEHCVRATVLDALERGFEVRVHAAAIRPVDPAAGARALAEMAEAGAMVIEPTTS